MFDDLKVSTQSLAARLYPGGLQHTGGLTRCLLRHGTTGLHNDFGNTFSERFSASIGPGYTCVNVQLAGWHFDFTSNDHHIDQARVRISHITYNAATGEVSFTVSGVYRDKNADDDFRWEVWWTILALG